MTIYHTVDAYRYMYKLDNWEIYLDDPTKDDTVIDITLKEYGKLFPEEPRTVYDLGSDSYLANWVDSQVDMEFINDEEIAARNITAIRMSYEDYVKLFGEEPVIEITDEMKKEQEEMTKLIDSLY